MLIALEQFFFLLLLFSIKDLKTVTIGKRADAERNTTNTFSESHLVRLVMVKQMWYHADDSSYGVFFFFPPCWFNSQQEKLQTFVPWVNSLSVSGLSITRHDNLHESLNTWHTSICTYFLIDHPSGIIFF